MADADAAAAAAAATGAADAAGGCCRWSCGCAAPAGFEATRSRMRRRRRERQSRGRRGRRRCVAEAAAVRVRVERWRLVMGRAELLQGGRRRTDLISSGAGSRSRGARSEKLKRPPRILSLSSPPVFAAVAIPSRWGGRRARVLRIAAEAGPCWRTWPTERRAPAHQRTREHKKLLHQLSLREPAARDELTATFKGSAVRATCTSTDRLHGRAPLEAPARSGGGRDCGCGCGCRCGCATGRGRVGGGGSRSEMASGSVIVAAAAHSAQ